MAVPVLASSSSFHDTGNNTSRNCAIPSGTVSGNWLVLVVGIDSAGTITTPTGWTLVKSFTEVSGIGTFYIFKRKADGTEGANLSIASTSEYATGTMYRITGADSTDCIDVVSMATGEIGSTSNVRFGECWAAYTDNLLIFATFLDGGTSTFSAAPSGATLIVSEAGGTSGNMMASWQKDQAAQGYTGFLKATTSNNTEQYVSFLIVIRSTSGAISYPSFPVRRVTDFYYPDATGACNYDLPYGSVSGETLLFCQEVDTSVLNPDTDFTSIQSGTSGAPDIRMQAYYRIIGGSESTPYTGMTSTSGAKMGVMIRLSNAHASSPINTSSSNTGTSVSPAGSTITPSVNNCLLLAFFAADDDDASVDTGYPSGWTGVFNQDTEEGVDSTFGMAYLEQSTAAATGTITWTNGLALSEEWIAFLIAIAPAAAANTTVDIPLSDKSKVAYAPSIAAGKTITVPLTTKARTALTPAVAAGKQVTVPLISKGKVAYTPDLQLIVTVGLVNKGKVAYTPTISHGVSIAVPLVNRGKVAYTPAIAIGAILTVPLVNKSKVAYTPSVASGAMVVVPLCNKGKVAYTPNILLGSAVAVPLCDKSKVAYTPAVSAGKSVAVPLVSKEKVVYGISVALSGQINVQLCDKGKVVFSMNVYANDIVVPLLDKSKVAFTPAIAIEGDGGATAGLHQRPMVMYPGVLLGHG